RTSANFIAPFLMKFPPSEPGGGFGKMSAVSEGISLEIGLELYIPASFQLNGFFDRFNTLWWLTALMRLRGAHRAQLPVVSDRPFSEIAENWQKAKALPVEVFPRRLPTAENLEELSLSDLQWLKEVWLTGGKLMGNRAAFNDAFQALDGAGGMPTKAVATLAIWGAFEHLFSPGKQELRFRVSANIATFLEDAGNERLKLQKKIMKLYDVRSSVAHTVKNPSSEEWVETLSLAHRILNKILITNHVPSKEDLELALFAPSTASPAQ
ncbi:MAG: hypothetical protein JWR40_265, partial [Massilia sp.]|nr:hypothetical protein [Massilia sp.]